MKRIVSLLILFLSIMSVNLFAENSLNQNNLTEDPAPVLTSISGPTTGSVGQTYTFTASPDFTAISPSTYHYRWTIMQGSGATIVSSNGNGCQIQFSQSGHFLITCQLVVYVNGQPTYPSTLIGHSIQIL